MVASGPERPDRLTWVASGMVAAAVVCLIGAAGVIWLYRQQAKGWSAPEPWVWQALTVAAMVLAGVAVVLSAVAIWKRHSALDRSGAVAWLAISLGVLIAAPLVVGRMTPDGEHAVVVAVDVQTGAMRWRSETGAWYLRRPAIEGDVVRLLAIGDADKPCADRMRPLALGLVDGSVQEVLDVPDLGVPPAPTVVPPPATVAPETVAPPATLVPPETAAPPANVVAPETTASPATVAPATTVAPPVAEVEVQGSELVNVSGGVEQWRIALDALQLPWANAVVAAGDTVIVVADGRAPLACST